MRSGTLLAVEDGREVLSLQRTDTYWERMRGLLGRSAPDKGTGLLISPCGSVHTFGMRYAIDVLYLDQAWRVIKLRSGLRPSRIDFARGARHVVELAAGEAKRLDLNRLTRVTWIEREAI